MRVGDSRRRRILIRHRRESSSAKWRRSSFAAAVTSSSYLQLWIATVLLAGLAALSYTGLRYWERAHDDRIAVQQALIDDALKTCEIANCDPKTDPSIPKAFATNRDLREVEEFTATQAWLRPAVLAFVFGIVPCLALLSHWLWHTSRRRRSHRAY